MSELRSVILQRMLRSFLISFIITLSIIGIAHRIPVAEGTEHVALPWWNIQSVDTMKYSRDLAREKLSDNGFDADIDRQIKSIADTGATHVAIATPYDPEFVPFLKRWETKARKYGLNVWFRGNFSGWERWFDYAKISREEHIRLLGQFIRTNPNLFQKGDIFTPCPECENGGPGDPRMTRDIDEYRAFLIQEYETARTAFRSIGKSVDVGYFSMNYDVAKLIMDRETTAKLGGVVTIDHYVKEPKTLVSDVRSIAHYSGGTVFLGEFGAPIPDIHKNMTESDQAAWISEAVSLLAEEPAVVGVNYWVNAGGSTALWKENGSPRNGVGSLRKAYAPEMVSGRVVGVLNKPITNVVVTSKYKSVKTDRSGRFSIPVLPHETTVSVYANNYIDKTIQIESLIQGNKIIIQKSSYSLLDRIISIFSNILLHR